MIEHLNDEELAQLAVCGEQDTHVGACASCRSRLRGWQLVVAGVGRARQAEPLRVPDFDTVGARLWGQAAPARAEPRQIGVVSWAWQLVLAQFRLLPISFWPLVVALLLLAGGAALAVDTAVAPSAAGAGTTLVAVLSASCVVRRESDPRNEMLSVAPVGPVLVLATRLLAVTAMAVASGFVISAALAVLRADLSLIQVVLAWLGPVVLALALTTLLGLAVAPAVGVLTGATLWAVATTASLSPLADRTSPLLRVWDTNLPTALLAAVLFCAALALVARGSGARPAGQQ